MARANRIKTDFISAVLRESAITIGEAQQKVIDEYKLFNTRAMYNMLVGHFDIAVSGETSKLTVKYLAYTRFLDMADNRRKQQAAGYNIYNKIVFGMLYNKTMPALKFGFTDEIRSMVGDAMQQAVKDSINK